MKKIISGGRLTLVPISILFCGLAQLANATAITNSDFSQINKKVIDGKNDGAGNYYNVTKGINNWEITGNVDRFTSTFWQLPAGADASIDLNGNQPGTVAQNVTADQGGYRITFLMSGDPNDPSEASSPSDKTMTLTVKGFPLLGGNTLLNAQSFSFDTSAKTGKGNSLANMMWTQMQSDEFTASGNFRIIFASTTKGSYGPAITDVQVVPSEAPEAASIMLIGGGLAGLACFRLRRFRRA